MTNKNIFAVHEKFSNLLKLYKEVETRPRNFGTDELLTGTEIHLIETIGENAESLSVTDLSRLLGVTKGAVSQNLKKLEKKGLTYKEEDPRNVSRSIVRLTSKGKAAFYSHKHWHETLDGGYFNYLEQLGEGKIEFLLKFMINIEKMLNGILSEK
jgi:DNA-binding MarR family transcriptional regulator